MASAKGRRDFPCVREWAPWKAERPSLMAVPKSDVVVSTAPDVAATLQGESHEHEDDERQGCH